MQIYTNTKEAQQFITVIKKRDPLFNFSEAFIEFLRAKAGAAATQEEMIEKNLQDARLKLAHAQNDVHYWEEQLQHYKVEQEILRIQTQDLERQQAAKQEKEQSLAQERRARFNEIFTEETHEAPTDQIYEDFKHRIDTKKITSIWQFCDLYKRRESVPA